ncbi:MAG: hypothetical protein JWN44_2312, partial [Myxococcales bacterium]|nr:hypothetical protein [Myxococcales bacterium]
SARMNRLCALVTVAVLPLGCSGVVDVPAVPDAPVPSESQSLGDPENGFPSPYERALFMAANRTRSDPSTVKGADSKLYPAAAPLTLAYDLERSSRFHSTMLAKGHAPLMHPSPCTLAADVGTSTCDGAPACGCVGGATCNSCDSAACTAGTDPGTRIKKFYSSSSFGWGEIIAAGYGEPWKTMDAWVDEPASADGHRQIVTSASYGVVGFGHAADNAGCYHSFDGGDFGGDKPAVGKIASAASKPIAGAAGTFRVYATWADPQNGAPTALRAVVDGACSEMQRELGDPKLNSTWYADVPLANGCHNVYVLGTAVGGQRAAYPTTTAFTINVGNQPSCPESVPQPVAACDGNGAPPDMTTAGSDMATVSSDMATGSTDMATPPADMATPPATAPTVSLDAPADGARYTLGSTIVVKATASAAPGRSIRSVVASWTRFGYTSTYPLTQTSPGQWQLSLQVTQRAGTRTISVSASDDAGKTSTSASVSVTAQ